MIGLAHSLFWACGSGLNAKVESGDSYRFSCADRQPLLAWLHVRFLDFNFLPQ